MPHEDDLAVILFQFPDGGFQSVLHFLAKGGRGGRDPAARIQRQMDEAEKTLTLTPDEKAAVLPLVKKVLEARSTLRTIWSR